VHSYGFEAETTPNIDALAARGVVFETAVAASTATVPSHASIMTSLAVREHSVGPWNGATRLEGAATLAEAFRRAGYETAAFVSNVVLKARTGLDHGFDLYDDDLGGSEANRGTHFERVARDTVERAVAWLAGERRGPFFVWVHLQDPHGPYTPDQPWSEVLAEVAMRTARPLPVLRANRGRGGIPAYQALRGVDRAPRYAALYAGEIALTDHWTGKLLAAAERAKGSAGLVVAFTADHGESLDENGFFFQHGHATTPEQVLVPFVIAAPGVAPERIDSVVGHVDLAPTLLELAGLDPLEDSTGVSLVPLMRGDQALPPRSIISDIGHELGVYDADGFLIVKVIRPDGFAAPLADAREAIREQRLDWQRFDKVLSDGRVSWQKRPDARLPDAVRDYVSREVSPVAARAMSDEDVERLRALGYLPPATN
jgi:arylsulfatase A-like enzyme